MRLILLMVMGALTLVLPSRMRAQDRDVRFEITAVGDTTLTFRAGRMTWVVRSPRAIVVDPKRRDALVARLKVVSVSSNGDATAVVTGQTGRITTEYFVLAEEPKQHWYKNVPLWMGAALGLVTGYVIGKA